MRTAKSLRLLPLALGFSLNATLAAADELTLTNARGSSPSGSSAECSRFELVTYFTGGTDRHLGWSIAKIGDVTGDGADDFASWGQSTGIGQPSIVYVFKGGATPGLLYDIAGRCTQPVVCFNTGFALSGTGGDISGDGVPDLIVGEPSYLSDISFPDIESNGRVHLYSGANGAPISTFTGPADGNMGFSVAPAGDVDQDGTLDFLAGNPSLGKILPAKIATGRAGLYSGVTGASLFSAAGVDDYDSLGYSVCALNVGTPRLRIVAGAAVENTDWTNLSGGWIRAYEVPSGNVAFTKSGFEFNESSSVIGGIGKAIARLKDINKDGYDEIVIGVTEGACFGKVAEVSVTPPSDLSIAGNPKCGTPYRGHVVVIDGFDGHSLFGLLGVGGPTYGSAVAGLGDIDGDGISDFAAGEPDANKVDVFSGHNGSLLCTIDKPAYSEVGYLVEGFGAAIEDGGSFNLDGCPAILIGAPYTGGCIECPLNLGMVLVYRSLCRCCFDKRGNVTGDALDNVDLSDLSALIAKLLGNEVFFPCVAEANINGVGTIDISDLSLLISHLTIIPRPLLPSCP